MELSCWLSLKHISALLHITRAAQRARGANAPDAQMRAEFPHLRLRAGVDIDPDLRRHARARLANHADRRAAERRRRRADAARRHDDQLVVLRGGADGDADPPADPDAGIATAERRITRPVKGKAARGLLGLERFDRWRLARRQ